MFLQKVNTLKQYIRRYYPWLVISLCALFLFYKYILQIFPSVMTNELMGYFQLNGLQLGNLAATFFYTYLITQLFVGPLLDKFNPRLLMTLAISICALGAWLFSTAHQLGYALSARALMGIGVAFATVGYMKMAAIWFEPRKFALISGLIPTFTMLGSMCGQTPMAWLVEAVDWQPTLFYVSMVGLCLAGLFYLCVRNYPVAQHACKHKHAVQLKLSDFLTIIKRRQNWILMLYSGLAFSPLAVFGGLWGNPFLQAQFHISKPQAATLTTFMFSGLAIGGPILCWISDKLNNRHGVMLWGVILSCISLSLAIYLPHISYITEAICLFSFGFGTGAFMLGFVVAKAINPAALAATVIGLINTGDALFGAFSEPLVGKILDIFWDGRAHHHVHVFSLHDYHLALLILPLYLLGASFCVLGVKKKEQLRIPS